MQTKANRIRTSLIPLLLTYPKQVRQPSVDYHFPQKTVFSLHNLSFFSKCMFRLFPYSVAAHYYRRQVETDMLLNTLREEASVDMPSEYYEQVNSLTPVNFVAHLVNFMDERSPLEIVRVIPDKMQYIHTFCDPENPNMEYEMWYDWDTFCFEYRSSLKVVQLAEETAEEYNNRITYMSTRSLLRRTLLPEAMKYVVAFNCRDAFFEERILKGRPWEHKEDIVLALQIREENKPKPLMILSTAKLDAELDAELCDSPVRGQLSYTNNAEDVMVETVEAYDENEIEELRVTNPEATTSNSFLIVATSHSDYENLIKKQHEKAKGTKGTFTHRMETKKEEALKKSKNGRVNSYGVNFRFLVPPPKPQINLPKIFALEWDEVLDEVKNQKNKKDFVDEILQLI